MTRNGSGVTDLIAGALAGAAATGAMGQVTTYLYAHEDPAAKQRENAARAGKTAYGIAAEKGASLVNVELSDSQRSRAGSALHWLTGAGAGAIYGALRSRYPAAAMGAGLVYGAAFFVLIDEAGNTALGLTPRPGAFPWQAHARGLLGHLAFGLTAELTLRAFDRIQH